MIDDHLVSGHLLTGTVKKLLPKALGSPRTIGEMEARSNPASPNGRGRYRDGELAPSPDSGTDWPGRGRLRKALARHLCYLTGMNDLEIVEVLARGAAAGVFFGLSIVVGCSGLSPSRVTGVLFCLAAAAHTLTQLPVLERVLGWTWPVVWALSVMGAGLFWAFATELFEDRQRLDARRFTPAAVLLAVGVAGAAAPVEASNPLWLAHNLLGAALMAHVLIVIATGWRNDLVEARRRLRGPISPPRRSMLCP